MSFEWKAFLSLARELQRQAPDSASPEAFYRSALSRVYFSVYCHARNYARDYLGFQPREHCDDHGRLRAHLKSKRRMADSDRLDRLRQWRNDCDYRDEVALDLADTLSTAMQLAERTYASLAPPKKS